MNADKLTKLVLKQSISSDDFLSELWKLSKNHRRQTRKHGVNKLEIVRTRTFNTKTRPKLIKELSYPPVGKASLQRANIEGQQIFYASVGLPTTLAESRVSSGQFIICSKWVNTKEFILQEVGFSARPSGLEKLYHDIFTSRNESTYEYTSRVAKHLMSGDFIAGLLYPSIVNQNQSHNLAIKKDYVDSGLSLVSATLYLVKDISSDSKYEVEQLDFATPKGEELDWKGRIKQWQMTRKGEELKFVSNGWDWNAYDRDGNKVEPQ